jgi:hypothetical protein
MIPLGQIYFSSRCAPALAVSARFARQQSIGRDQWMFSRPLTDRAAEPQKEIGLSLGDFLGGYYIHPPTK